MDPKLLTSAESNATLGELQQQLNRLQRKVRLTIQTQLASITGRSLIASIQEVLEGHGLRIQCAECGHPAILRVSPRPGSSTGVFVFDHTLDGRRTFHGGGSVVPAIKLVAKPPRKKRRRAAG